MVPCFWLPTDTWTIDKSDKHAKIKHSCHLVKIVFLCLQLSYPTWCLASLAPKSPFWYATKCLFSKWQTTTASICIVQFLWQKHLSPNAGNHEKQRCLCSPRNNITEAESEYPPICFTSLRYVGPEYVWWRCDFWTHTQRIWFLRFVSTDLSSYFEG